LEFWLCKLQCGLRGIPENTGTGTDAMLLFFSIDHYRNLCDEIGFAAVERSANKKGIAVIASYVEDAAYLKILW